ncbi:flagellar biosynthesis protein FlhB [Hydrocarboniclastica marina]|uniref:Flagellar biosynthetic protein FlhB n=1 Tax=Hydrocarboniclastica marina TaxID=2259620 RepID=A0A4P7XFI0_9ALTE|nr:flagellar biosynthesis protein FlhB [Hydrocarboniclastica marina]MAL98565.1 flagellar biosynthesis protein FlhB [Alteromonadaceae bacterium]QCF25686.1 flagellar biosynthesis protein FlhB [Hydrocarboniclastica marina]
MAEDSSGGQEKTEDPTQRRLDKSREDGQVARSRELGTMAVLMTGAAGLMIFGGSIGSGMMDIMRDNFALSRSAIEQPGQMMEHLRDAGWHMGLLTLPLLVILSISAIVGTIGIGGILLSGKALLPKFSRMNPVSGLKKMIGPNSLVELVKSIAKVSLVLTIALTVLNMRVEDLLAMEWEAPEPAIEHMLWTVGWTFFLLSCSMILVAAIDVPFQIYSHQKKLKMTKQEVKDEFKETEGKPEVKGRIRRLQMEMSQRRMMQDVPTADVVITNPTHYAVALKYDAKSMGAPIVVAKGADEIALTIGRIARENKVELLQSPPLTRAIYHSTEIGGEIPGGLYIAVAQVLAYLYQLRQYRRGQGDRPPKPDTPIPDELRRDS